MLFNVYSEKGIGIRWNRGNNANTTLYYPEGHIIYFFRRYICILKIK